MINQNSSKQTILDYFNSKQITLYSKEFWKLLNHLKPDEQVEVAAKIGNWSQDKDNPALSENQFNNKSKSRNNLSLEQTLNNEHSSTVAEMIPSNNGFGYELTRTIEQLKERALTAGSSTRNAEIFACYDAGESKKQIAKQFNLSETQVANIVRTVTDTIYQYIDEKEDWFQVFNQETRKTIKHFNARGTNVAEEVREARETVEELGGFSTQYRVNDYSQTTKTLILEKGNETYKMSQAQVIKLAESYKLLEEYKKQGMTGEVIIQINKNGTAKPTELVINKQ